MKAIKKLWKSAIGIALAVIMSISAIPNTGILADSDYVLADTLYVYTYNVANYIAPINYYEKGQGANPSKDNNQFVDMKWYSLHTVGLDDIGFGTEITWGDFRKALGKIFVYLMGYKDSWRTDTWIP